MDSYVQLWGFARIEQSVGCNDVFAGSVLQT